MRKSAIDWAKKVEAVKKYQRGEGSQNSIAREYGVGRSSLRQWIANYEAMVRLDWVYCSQEVRHAAAKNKLN